MSLFHEVFITVIKYLVSKYLNHELSYHIFYYNSWGINSYTANAIYGGYPVQGRGGGFNAGSVSPPPEMSTLLLAMHPPAINIVHTYKIVFPNTISISIRVSRSQPGSHNASISTVTKQGGMVTPPLPRAISNTLAKISSRDGSRSPSVSSVFG